MLIRTPVHQTVAFQFRAIDFCESKSGGDRAKLEISAIAVHGGKMVDEIGLGAGFGHHRAPQGKVHSSCARTEPPKLAGGVNRKSSNQR